MPRSIPLFLNETADRLPKKLAIVSDARSVDFHQLRHEVLATAECLRELGVKPGNRIGVCMDKSVDQISVMLGILYANAIMVPILPLLKSTNIQHIIENSSMTALVTDAIRLDEVSAFAHLTRLLVGHGNVDQDWPNLADMRRFLRPCLFFDRIGSDSAAIIYSSGSTGRPKGILISHRNLADGADIVASYLDTQEEDRIGCVMSFNFDYALSQLWQTIRKGATLYLHDFLLPSDLFAWLADNHVTALPLMPVIISQMFDRRLKIRTSSYDLSALRYVCSTGGRLSQDMIDDLQKAFSSAKIYSMFGLTEAFRGTYLAPEKLATHPTSIGKAIPGCQILILDDTGTECPPNVIGELVQRGATVTKGYWRDPENTSKVFRQHPAFPGETLVYSGDNAYRDEDGYLYFVARRDEMIKTRGFRVSPTEVESEVLSHPAITAAVAFAVPNIEIGEDIACAYLTESGQELSKRTLKQYLKDRLPGHMMPAHFLYFDRFPITGNAGKFARKQIKQESLMLLGVEIDR